VPLAQSSKNLGTGSACRKKTPSTVLNMKNLMVRKDKAGGFDDDDDDDASIITFGEIM